RDHTIFMGGLHDTTQDVLQFFDKDLVLSMEQRLAHLTNKKVMRDALLLNAKERSRRFENINKESSLMNIHKEIKRRSISFFEPRPEYNHATNALCIVGRRDMTKGLFLDRRAFLNSYHYSKDKEGKFLQGILNAAAPVCGGINLEYYFSRTDNQKLGSGSKLPHNVIGLFGVANGIEGDLRPGLPAQMIEIHEPIRLMIVVEQFPEVIVSAIKANKATYEWFVNEWIHLICYHPTENRMLQFKNGTFEDLILLDHLTPTLSSHELLTEFEHNKENIAVKRITN
ncbi:MAG: putative inorganic carbon transporter subunit DabA, partial [Chitinophagales bacterium]